MRTSWITLLCIAVVWMASPATANSGPVADAARRGDLETVRALLTENADVNAPLGDGMTALHWAAYRGNEPLVELLLEAGASTTAVTRLGQHTPLHVASRAAREAVVRALLASGADPAAVTETGATPLHFAAGSGADGAIDALLDGGALIDATEPTWGQTSLMFAAASDRATTVALLLSRGANPDRAGRVVDISARDTADRADSLRRRERIAALRAGRTPTDELSEVTLSSRAASTAPPSPAVRAAAAAADAVEREADLQEEPEPLGFADLVGTHGGLTPLLLAARDGHIKTVLALLQGGADINRVSAADGTSPLLIAAINGHFDLALALLTRGADPTLASDAGATPLYGTLNIQWAPKARHPQPTDYMQQATSYLELMTALVDAGADVNVRLDRSLWYTTYNRDLLGVDRAGATPFWRAAYALDLDAMRLLLSHGADPHIPTIKVPSRQRPLDPDPSGLPPTPMGGPGVSPLLAAAGVGYGQGYAGNTHRHVPGGWLPTVRFLVEELGANVHFRDHNGYNPVHHAAARGDNSLIRYLVAQGVDVTEVSRTGQTTVDMANGPVQRIQPFPDTIALLESLGATNSHRCLSC